MSGSESPFQDTDRIFGAEVPSRLSERERLIDEVLDRLEAFGCRLDRFLDRLCLDEALSNAILHGNREDPEKRIRVAAYCSESLWGVEIIDEGAGFDWRAELDRASTAPEAGAPSGRGLAILSSSGAELWFLEGGRRLLITRRRE